MSLGASASMCTASKSFGVPQGTDNVDAKKGEICKSLNSHRISKGRPTFQQIDTVQDFAVVSISAQPPVGLKVSRMMLITNALRHF
jgi:hypothetical protein